MRKNLLAAYAGILVNLLVPLIVTPFVLKALGTEAYGLIGIGLMLQSILTFLEAGLSASMSRAFAERTATLDDVDSRAGMLDLLRTLEFFYFALVGFVCLLVLLLAPLIATYWVTDHKLPNAMVWQSIALIGVMVAMRFLVSLYGGGLVGLQRQVMLNATSITLSVFANSGAVVVLFWVSSDPRAYFAWLAIMGAVTAISLRFALAAALPSPPRPPRFDWNQWLSIRRLSVGISTLTVTSLAVTQADKLLLSRFLPLRDFGFYSIASNVANFVQLITIPIQTVYYPRMTQCRAKGDTEALLDTYRFASRMVALVVFPLGFTLALFSHDILLVWLRNPEVAEQVHMILSLLVVGTTLLTSLMMMPYAMTLAHADTRITLNSHAVLLCIQLPAVVYFAIEFGAVGAAGLWCALFCIYGPLYAWRVNRKYLPSSHARWLWECVLRPALPALVAVVVVKQAVTLAGLAVGFAVLYLPLAWGLSLLAAWLAAPLPGIRLRTLSRSA
jgi:O-antigen/teichoic acid export membrane protein